MKNKSTFLVRSFSLILLAVISISCGSTIHISKRKHRNGIHVSFGTKNSQILKTSKSRILARPVQIEKISDERIYKISTSEKAPEIIYSKLSKAKKIPIVLKLNPDSIIKNPATTFLKPTIEKIKKKKLIQKKKSYLKPMALILLIIILVIFLFYVIGNYLLFKDFEFRV